MNAPRSLGRRALPALAVLLVSATLAGTAATPAVGLQPTSQSVIVSADPANFTPNVQNGKVLAILQIGNRVILGGVFSSVKNTAANGGQTYARSNLLAFNATSGVVDPGFNPTVNGEVSALAAGPDGSLFVGGNFSSVNGQSRRGIAKLNPTSGALWTGFSTVTNGRVRDLVVRGSRVFVGGNFSKIGTASRARFGAFNATTGVVDPLNLPIQAPYTAGSGSNVLKIDVTPSGDRLVLVGNFSQIANEARWQVAVVNLTTNTLAPWNTDRWNAGTCNTRFKEYPRDVEFAPDGSYFVVVSTGAGYWPETLCDTASRWPTYSSSGDVDPDWIAYSGGDTFFAVGVTGAAVYVGGHMRWMNDAAVGDVAEMGAVSRPGIAALDPQNGVPFDWNPVRNPRGLGVFDFLATDAGLWFGSDTSGVGGEQHGRIAFFPAQGGRTPVVGRLATLPGDLFSTGTKTCASVDRSILFRVNAGGPRLPADDCGVDWAADDGGPNPNRNDGSTTAAWSGVGTVAGSVPAGTPSELFSTERWDPGDAPEMEWNIPATAGHHLQVRLYFAARCDCTNDPGERVFDVAIDGTTVLNDYDIVATDGFDRGVMKSFAITSDGNVDIDFSHVVENPLIDGIEIVDTDQPSGPAPTPSTNLARRTGFSGAAPVPSPASVATSVDWSKARGAFYLNGTLYAGWSDGRLYGWAFNGATLGAQRDILQEGNYVLGPTWISFASVTGMYWDAGRLYYTRSGDSRLFYRYFSPDSELVGSVDYVASGDGDGLDWSVTSGITFAGGRLFFATSDGNLHRMDADALGTPVPGTDTVLAGPGIDGRNYASNGMFVRS